MLRIKLRSTFRTSRPHMGESENLTPEKTNTPLSAKKKMQIYREKMKENDALYKTHLEAEALRNRNYRKNLTKEEKERQRDKTRLRVQRWREKKKSEEENGSLVKEIAQKPKPKTRMQKEKMRGYWKKKKMEQRSAMSGQKRRRINEQRRKKYAEKKTISTKSPTNSSQLQSQGSYTTKEAKRKAIYRAGKHMPSAAQKFADVFIGLASKSTPRKRKALAEGGILTTPCKKRLFQFDNIQAELFNSRKLRSSGVLRRRRVLAHCVAKTRQRLKSGLSWKFAVKCSQLKDVWDDDSRKKRSDALTEETVESVDKFYKKIDNSVCMPDKKHVSIKSWEPKRILQTSLKETYRKFLEENKDDNLCHISFSKFASLRPRAVKTMDHNLFNSCLCEYCSNIELKVKAISSSGFKSPVHNRYDVSKMTLCTKPVGTKFHNKECVDRTCPKCGTYLLDLKLLPTIKLRRNSKLDWHKWETQSYTVANKRKSRKMLQLKSGSVEAFLKELKAEVEVFSSHLHNAQWQYNQFCLLTDNIPSNWTVFCMDFAENYTCLYQDEAQSAHWSHSLVTLFSIVAYFRCPSCKVCMHESLVFVADDRHHDSHAVQHFVCLANRHLMNKYKLQIEKQIHFSDGAASQFKSKTPFADVAHSIEDLGFPIEKHFFGSRHGKGPCDGEFGVIKRMASNAVMTRKSIIRNSQEFYLYGKTNLSKPKHEENHEECVHARRTFFLVEENDINRNRPDRINAKPIAQTRKLHAIRVSSDNHTVDTRFLSCFCKECTVGNCHRCENSDNVSDWQNQHAKKAKKTKEGKRVPNKNQSDNAMRTKEQSVDNLEDDLDLDDSVLESIMKMVDKDQLAPSLDCQVSTSQEGQHTLFSEDQLAIFTETFQGQFSLPTEDHLPSSSVDVDSTSTRGKLSYQSEIQLPSAQGDQLPYLSELPSVQGDQLPYLSENQLPFAQGEQLPYLSETQLPSALGDQLPSVKGDQLPSTKGDQLPSTKGDPLPSTQGDQQPSTKGDPLPSTRGDPLPLTKGDQLQSTCTRFQTGSYIAINHGDMIYPAVIDIWPFVRFFKLQSRRGISRFWSQGDIVHTVLLADVKGPLRVPSIQMSGSRFYYLFPDLD